MAHFIESEGGILMPHSPTGVYEREEQPKQTTEETTQDSTLFLRPTPGHIIVAPDEPKKKIGSIIVPQKHRQFPTTGNIVAVGDYGQQDEYGNAHSDKSSLVGKRIVWGRMSGVPLFFSGKREYLVLTYEEILAFVEDDSEVDLEKLASLTRE